MVVSRPSVGRAAPLVFAHRGGAAALPEHTLGAYLRAINEGVDGLECDVRLTNDGHLVCVHDRRLERTSNGRGLVSEHTLEQLHALDFGSWHPGFPDSADELVIGVSAVPEPVRVLTLDLLLAAASLARRPLRLLIETKHPTRFGGEVEARLAAMLRRYGMHRPDPDGVSVTVMSFSMAAVRRVRELAPELPTVLLMELLPPWLRDGRLPAGTRIAAPGVELLRARPWLAERIHRRGYQMYVWTVNSAADVELVLGLGAEGIISDRPRMVLECLGR